MGEHFVGCILEGLRQARSKPLNYGKLADTEQEEKEAPGKFLDRLREALRRFTEIDPESEEGRVILKDRFLTQVQIFAWIFGLQRTILQEGLPP